MLTEERQYQITELIRKDGKASITELAARFGVSGETIRRDLSAIASKGLVRKVHGGAVAVRRPVRDASYELRQVQSARNKQAIGEYAASLIRDNMVIGIDSGTCAEGFARAIRGVNNLTVITYSIPIAEILAQKIANGEFTGSIRLLGGIIHPDTLTACDMTALSLLQSFRMDLAFLAVTALSESGLMAGTEQDGMMTAALLRQSDMAYALAESEKFGKQSYFRVAPLSDVPAVITDNEIPLPREMEAALSNGGVDLRIVPLSEHR